MELIRIAFAKRWNGDEVKIEQEASARLAQNAKTRTNIEIVDNSYVAGAAL